MKQALKRMAAALAALLLLATGCSKQEGVLPNEGGETQAMGRYMENICTLPEGIGYTSGLWRAPDGALELLANRSPERAVGKWYLFRSTDGGNTWTESDLPWLAELQSAIITAADRDDAGNWIIQCTQIPQAMVDAMLRGEPPAEESAGEVKEKLLWGKPDGSVEELTWELPINPTDAGVQSMRLASNGDLLIATYSELIQVELATGKKKNSYKQEAAYRLSSYQTYGNTLALNDGPNIVLYDLTTGESTGSIPCVEEKKQDSKYSYTAEGDQSVERAIALDAKGEALYFCDATGIYRRLVDGTVNERPVDGGLTALNMPANKIENLAVQANGDLMVLISGVDGHELYRYTYDATIPTVPNKELNIYSLYDNKTIRQAIGLYQRNNPDVHVVLETGMDGGAETVSDALRNLSTELLADKGPDLLVLDGLPIESYIEKGVLLDLSEQISGNVTSGTYLKNIAESFKRDDGTIYALPARFTVPMMLAEDPDKLQTLSALADWLVQENAATPKPYSTPMGEVSPAYLMQMFYPVCAPAWTAPDGSIETETFQTFLSDLKRIYDLHNTPEDEPFTDEYLAPDGSNFNMEFGSLYWAYQKQAVAPGYATSFYSIAPADAAITQAGSGALALLPGQTDGVYIPGTVLGISANSRQPELAQAFLESVVSTPVQEIRFDDGFPINAEALAQFAQNPYAEFDDGMSYGSNDPDGGELLMLRVKWPTDAYVQGWMERIKALDTPSMPDMVVRQMVIDQSKDYFAGAKSLADTVAAVTEKVNLYRAE